MPGRHNKKTNLQLSTCTCTHNSKCTDGGRMWTHVSCVPHVFVSRLLQCISHASQKHHPLWSYVPPVLPRRRCGGRCGCSLGSADLYERWNSTNHQEHGTAPKKQLVDHGSLSQQNKLARIDRAHLPQRVHEPKLTLMHELGKRNVYDRKTSAQAKERYRNLQNYPQWAHAKLECAQKRASDCARRYYRMAPNTTIVVQLLEREAYSQTKKSRINTWKASSPKRPRTSP